MENNSLKIEKVQFVPLGLFCGYHPNEATLEVSGNAQLNDMELDIPKFRLIVIENENNQIKCQFECTFSDLKI